MQFKIFYLHFSDTLFSSGISISCSSLLSESDLTLSSITGFNCFAFFDTLLSGERY